MLNDSLNFWFENKVIHVKEAPRVLYQSFANNYLYPTFSDVDVERVIAREWIQWFNVITDKQKQLI